MKFALDRATNKYASNHIKGNMGTKIYLQSGYAVDIARKRNVEAIINSANDGLILGTGGAGRIRKTSGFIPNNTPDYDIFIDLCNKTGGIGNSCKRWLDKQHSSPTYVQKECLQYIYQNGGRPVEIGSAYITSAGKLKVPRYIIHAVGMGYEWSQGTKSKRIRATEDTVKNALVNSISLARQNNIEEIALPLMCVRKSYGITPKESHDITRDVLSESGLRRAIICADNKISRCFYCLIKLIGRTVFF